MILVPLDPNRERYRWRAPFGDALRATLRRTEPRMESRLRGRASTWHQRHGDPDRAIDQAVAAGDVERTGDLLWANILRYLMHGRSDTVGDWLSSFCPDQIADYAPLALAAAHHCLVIGELDQAQHWNLTATEARRRGRAATATKSLDAGKAIIDATAARISAIEMGAVAARAYEAEPEHSPWRSFGCLLRGTAEYLTGDRESATDQLEEGLQLGAIAAPWIAALCLTGRGLPAELVARLPGATQTLRRVRIGPPVLEPIDSPATVPEPRLAVALPPHPVSAGHPDLDMWSSTRSISTSSPSARGDCRCQRARQVHTRQRAVQVPPLSGGLKVL